MALIGFFFWLSDRVILAIETVTRRAWLIGCCSSNVGGSDSVM